MIRTHPRSVGLGDLTHGDRGHLCTFLDQEPVLWLEPLAHVPVGPGLVGIMGEAPRVREGVHVRLVRGALVAFAKAPNREAVGPGPARGGRCEVDLHAKGVPERAEACLLVRLVELGVLLGRPSAHVGQLVGGSAFGDGLDQRLVCSWVRPTHVEPGRFAVRDHVCVADQPPVGLCNQNVVREDHLGGAPAFLQLGRRHVVGAVEPTRVLVEDLGRCLRLVHARMSNLDRAHCGTSSSAVSGSDERSGSSRSGSGSACSPSRLTQIVRSPSSLPGATSWKRLAATWT